MRVLGSATLVVAAVLWAPAQVWGAQLPDNPRSACGDSLKDLPLIEAPAAREGSTLAVMISGDGGWAALDRGVAAELTRADVFVVGLNSLHYFFHTKTPEQAAHDYERIVRCYMASTGRRELVLMGYSRGAEILPFVVSRLPEDLRRQTRLVVLLGPGQGAQFKFHVVDWWSDVHRDSDLPVLPEARRFVSTLPVLCVYGADETDTVCPALKADGAQAVALTGGHHFDGGYDQLGQIVVRALTARAGN